MELLLSLLSLLLVAMLSQAGAGRGGGGRHGGRHAGGNRPFKKFHVPNQREGKDFRIHYETFAEKADDSGKDGNNHEDNKAAAPSVVDPADESVQNALARHADLKQQVADTLDLVHSHTKKHSRQQGHKPGRNDNKQKAGGAHKDGDNEEVLDTDFYDFDFYRDGCDEPRDAFGFMCSEYVFAGEYTCSQQMHERGYEDCHCACQDAYVCGVCGRLVELAG